MLVASSTGEQISPMLVYHSTKSRIEEVEEENLAIRRGFGLRLWEEVKRIEAITNMKIYGKSTAWWNSVLSIEFLRHHFANRVDSEQLVMLLWDDFSDHWYKGVVAYATSINVVLEPGMTLVAQPADVAWMRPLKDRLRAA